MFSAFKNHQKIKEITGALLDKEGNVKPYDLFEQEALKISKQYDQNWLRTEYNMAVRSARSAKNWKDIERTKHLYPNLEYMPSRAGDQRDGHKQFYNKVYPIDHSFWDSHLPPNGWGCKCSVRKTRKTADEENPVSQKPISGIVGNAGKVGEIFSATHGMVKNTSKEEKKSIKEQLDNLELTTIRKEATKWALKELRQKSVKTTINNKEVSIGINRKGISKFLGEKSGVFYDIEMRNKKNLLLYDFEELIKKSSYHSSKTKTITPAKKNDERDKTRYEKEVIRKTNIKTYHYFELKLNKKNVYLNIIESNRSEFKLYTITEAISKK